MRDNILRRLSPSQKARLLEIPAWKWVPLSVSSHLSCPRLMVLCSDQVPWCPLGVALHPDYPYTVSQSPMARDVAKALAPGHHSDQYAEILALTGEFIYDWDHGLINPADLPGMMEEGGSTEYPDYYPNYIDPGVAD